MSEIIFANTISLADFALDAIAEHAAGMASCYRDKAWDAFDDEWASLESARRLAYGEGVTAEMVKDIEAAAMTSIEL